MAGLHFLRKTFPELVDTDLAFSEVVDSPPRMVEKSESSCDMEVEEPEKL